MDRPLNVLLVSIDTLRADRLGCYGYARDTSPALDRFARERAVRFANAIAESPWTLPSHITLLSGLHPLRHGVRLPAQAPSHEFELLAETLARAGRYTFAITDGGWLTERRGFDRGFESFHALDQDFEETVERALEYVRHRTTKGPWFAFLHTYDVHCPYDPPEPYAGMFRSEASEPIEVAGRCGNPDFNALELTAGQTSFLSDRYDDDIRRTDDALGKLLAGLDELDLWSSTIVIVTSDHGEEFGERGRIGHEQTLQREVLHIPLLVAAPGIGARTVETAVGLADVVPTVLELAGLAPARELDGRSLVPLLRGGAGPERPGGQLSELVWKRKLASWVEGDEHWIVDLGDSSVRRFDWKSDPTEREDLAAEDERGLPEPALELQRALERGQFTPHDLTSDVIESKLRALGY